MFQPKDIRFFNCYSYAVNHREKWLLIKEKYYYPRYTRKPNDINKVASNAINEDVLINFPELMIVDKKDIKEGTKLIAFKLSIGDFHFMKRFPNGHWFHKRGNSTIEPIKKEKVFANTWYDNYISETIFLGYKEDYA